MAYPATGKMNTTPSDSVYILKTESGETVKSYVVPTSESESFEKDIWSQIDKLAATFNRGPLTVIQVKKLSG